MNPCHPHLSGIQYISESAIALVLSSMKLDPKQLRGKRVRKHALLTFLLKPSLWNKVVYIEEVEEEEKNSADVGVVKIPSKHEPLRCVVAWNARIAVDRNEPNNELADLHHCNQ
eukprot:CAMPEP_0195648900 /NCGR_PEP_ID=MMETSP0815-20121206/30894_1 /TAXON_ID=97485 /ORGANISM="Prymnesium parvum, Strain Texoma1" /LENGTH=113 /DNA_ID=CAMNT_0040792597 /DNA_START=212 /DNA_END=553 /DNA_ORIENTATION=+